MLTENTMSRLQILDNFAEMTSFDAFLVFNVFVSLVGPFGCLCRLLKNGLQGGKKIQLSATLPHLLMLQLYVDWTGVGGRALTGSGYPRAI